MGKFRSGAGMGMAVLLALLAEAPPQVAAQDPTDPPRTSKSVYGKLESVDRSLNGVVMKSDGGERLAWRFDPKVIAEAVKFKPGDPMIVIYRQMAANEKMVTALAFPGAAATPTYLNFTGSRVVLRSAPMVDRVCGNPEAAPVSESTVPIGGMAEAMEACWCCAYAGDTCTPANKSGNGRAILVQCFK